MEKDLRSLCPTAAMYTWIKNALWYANGRGFIAPDGWIPKPHHFSSLNPNTIINIGSKALEILREWVKAND